MINALEHVGVQLYVAARVALLDQGLLLLGKVVVLRKAIKIHQPVVKEVVLVRHQAVVHKQVGKVVGAQVLVVEDQLVDKAVALEVQIVAVEVHLRMDKEVVLPVHLEMVLQVETVKEAVRRTLIRELPQPVVQVVALLHQHQEVQLLAQVQEVELHLPDQTQPIQEEVQDQAAVQLIKVANQDV